MIGLRRMLCLFFISLFAFNFCSISIAQAPTPDVEEDALDDEATVESDEKVAADGGKGDEKALTEQDKGAEEEMPDGLPKPHPSIETNLLFTDPHGIGQIPRPSSIVPLEVPVGRPVHVLIGCRHVGGGNADFTLDAVSAHLRYPMDFSYYIQNFTVSRLEQVIQANEELSIAYAFAPAQQLSGRPYGLTVRLFYHDAEGLNYVSTVMNETVQLIDWEGPYGSRTIDTEAIFLYLVIAGISGLILLGIYQLWQSYAPKSLRTSSKKHANSKWSSSAASSNHGQSNKKRSDDDNGLYEDAAAAARAKGVDVDWIPREHLIRSKTRKSPQQSPRQRKGHADATREESD